MRIIISVFAVLLGMVVPALSQEDSLPSILEEIGRLEGARDPKCFATANRLEDFMYGTPLSLEARVEKIALQKDLVYQAWEAASLDASSRGKQAAGTTEIGFELATRLNYTRTVAGDIVVFVPSESTLTLLADDLRQYGSVAYGLRTVLSVQQESLLLSDSILLPLESESIQLLKDILDIHTLAALQLADRTARLADAREISGPMLVDAWRSLQSAKVTHPSEKEKTDLPRAARAVGPSDFATTRALIEQKVNSYKDYNEISQAVFVRNLQVYFARHRWPVGDEEKPFRDYFTETMILFANDSLLGAQAVARGADHSLIAVKDVDQYLISFLPHKVNVYEDVIYFPNLPAEDRIIIESYDLDAFRDSGLHWMYLKWAIEEPGFAGTVEPDPFASELLAEGVAQFGVLVLRVAGLVAKGEGSERLAVRHLEGGLRRIQAMINRHATLKPNFEAPVAAVASSGITQSTVEGHYFTDVTALSGIQFQHRTSDWLSRLIRSYTVKDGEIARLAIPPAFGGGGVAAEDIDNDGDPDVLLLGGAGNRLFTNDGLGNFTDITAEAGIGWKRGNDGHPGEPRQPIVADFDNDGFQDIFISYVGDDHRLYRNLGGTRFEDVSKRAGLGGKNDVAGPATAFDFDGDGLLDLYIGSFGDYPHGVFPTLERRNRNGLPNHLFRNVGGLRFEDVTEGSGVANNGWTQAVGHVDFDRDGREDLIVGNDFGVNSYYRNLGNGRFEDVSRSLGTDKPSYTMNIGIADLNRDSYPDFYISNIVTMDKDEKYVMPGSKTRMKFDPASMAHLRVVEANDLFTSRAGEQGLAGYVLSDAVGRGRSSTGWSWDADFFDFDNDGDDDLYCTNGMNEYALYSSENPYYADPEGQARKVVIPVAESESNVFFVNSDGGLHNDSEASGANYLGNTRSVAYLDFDLDGDLDMIVNNFHGPAILYRNNAESRGNHWIGIRLVGDPNQGSTRDAVGAVIEISTKNQKNMWREVLSTTGYLSVHPKTQHFGLGKDTSADVTVHWPGGGISTLSALPANTVTVILERQRAGGAHDGESFEEVASRLPE